MQDDIYVGPPTFSLAPQWPSTFLILESPLHSRRRTYSFEDAYLISSVHFASWGKICFEVFWQ